MSLCVAGLVQGFQSSNDRERVLRNYQVADCSLNESLSTAARGYRILPNAYRDVFVWLDGKIRPSYFGPHICFSEVTNG
jgi:hypothetical protein